MNTAARLALLVLGWIFLAIGAVGLFVPILPTVPFLLLAAACFLRSSARLHRWLLEHPVFGRDLSVYLEGKGIRKRSKVIAIITLWISTGVSTILFVPYFVVDLLLIAIAAAVTAHILGLPTASAE